MDEHSKKKILRVVYTNWKGETEPRNLLPERIWFGSNEYHKEEQWIMDAFDVDRHTSRSFALKDIRVMY